MACSGGVVWRLVCGMMVMWCREYVGRGGGGGVSAVGAKKSY